MNLKLLLRLLGIDLKRPGQALVKVIELVGKEQVVAEFFRVFGTLTPHGRVTLSQDLAALEQAILAKNDRAAAAQMVEILYSIR